MTGRSDGKVHLFDLFENKNDTLCMQKIVKRGGLTHLQFNNNEFILIVGDDKGGVISLKLSPNLRKSHLPAEEGGGLITSEKLSEIQKEILETLITALDVKPPTSSVVDESA